MGFPFLKCSDTIERQSGDEVKNKKGESSLLSEWCALCLTPVIFITQSRSR